MALAIAATAGAQSFVPFGGYEGNSHFVLEPSVAGFAKTDNAVLSHGTIPALSLYTSGIERVNAAESNLSASVSADGASISVTGLDSEAAYSLYASDGRLLASGTVAPGAAIALPRTTAPTLLLRVAPAATASVVFHLLNK